MTKQTTVTTAYYFDYAYFKQCPPRGGRKLSVRVQVVQSQCFVEPTRRNSLAG